MGLFAWTNQIFQMVGGLLYNTNPPVITPGSTGPMIGDNIGRLCVIPGVRGAPLSLASTVWGDTAALGASGVIKAAPGNLLRAFATNTSGADVFFQAFNKTTVPVANDVPTFSINVKANTSMPPWDLSRTSRPYTTGISWGASTTSALYTAATAIMWVSWEIDQ